MYNTKFLTDNYIEGHAERAMDTLDRALMAGEIDSDRYEIEVRNLNYWVEAKYAQLRRSKSATN